MNVTNQSLKKKKVKFLCPRCTNTPISFQLGPELDKSLMNSNPTRLTLWLCGLFEVGFKPQRESLPLCAHKRPHLVHVEPRAARWCGTSFGSGKDLSVLILLIYFFFSLKGCFCCESDERCFTSNVKPSSGAEPVAFQGGCLVAVGERERRRKKKKKWEC